MYFKNINKTDEIYDKNIALYFEGKIDICEHISEENKLLLKKLIEKENFSGKKEERLEVSFLEEAQLTNMVLIGMGKEESHVKENLRKTIYEVLDGVKGSVLITASNEKLQDPDTIAEVSNYLNYNFNKYKAGKKEKDLKIELLSSREGEPGKEGNILGQSVNITRDLINEPANVIYPETLAIHTIFMGQKYGFEVEVLHENTIESLGMKAYLAVARAAEKKPKFIVMRYKGDPKNPEEIIGLVGKGVTYDTGGLSIKPSDGMASMKSDMGGAAVVIGTMTAVARMKLKKNVVAVIAACENSIGGNAYRPGDIIGSMAGKSIEVVNTDAEGRMTLIDAITYIIRNEKVTEVIDVATLTGGVIIALGHDATGVFTNTDKMYKNLQIASKKWGEEVWRLPLLPQYKELIKSDVADLKNTGGKLASAATAAKFLEEFVENIPWMHLDIAGTSFIFSEKGYSKMGATGETVRTLYSYIKG
ncbi:leucyl aminopeptidase [uncultured Ilyobacter sp.]|uniref:leucyl aminopeptidase n=1 Tax=uncultured Ilyobacter sp. TaxID=544433 RepID=UPI002AA764ED|nr:leucyl aminopeptidase [uncultured Ilyobacter sp.]